VSELPEEVKKALNIVYMDNVDDAVKVALRSLKIRCFPTGKRER
jgi:ATP-dependent Lon protease